MISATACRKFEVNLRILTTAKCFAEKLMSNSSVDKTARAVCTGKKLNKIIHDNSFRHLAHPLSNLITFINGNNGFVVAMFS